METYYNPEDLAKFSSLSEGAPELWKKFSEWYGAVFAEGALT
ncbi:MAG: 4-carboxymuconolactone decarboxylase, partial [Deltaproteobacteria bacterium]|nr:4-carboxymuconolactone decarboxylase [Deltaproteobacteria bacterium]